AEGLASRQALGFAPARGPTPELITPNDAASRSAARNESTGRQPGPHPALRHRGTAARRDDGGWPRRHGFSPPEMRSSLTGSFGQLHEQDPLLQGWRIQISQPARPGGSAANLMLGRVAPRGVFPPRWVVARGCAAPCLDAALRAGQWSSTAAKGA